MHRPMMVFDSVKTQQTLGIRSFNDEIALLTLAGSNALIYNIHVEWANMISISHTVFESYNTHKRNRPVAQGHLPRQSR